MASILKVDTLQKPDGSAPSAIELGINMSGSVVGEGFYTWGTRTTYSGAVLVTVMDTRTYVKKYDSSTSYLVVDILSPVRSYWSYANSPYLLIDGSTIIRGYGHHVDTATSGTNSASFNKTVQIRCAVTDLEAGAHTFAGKLDNYNTGGYQDCVVNPTNANDGRYPPTNYSTMRITEIMY